MNIGFVSPSANRTPRRSLRDIDTDSLLNESVTSSGKKKKSKHLPPQFRLEIPKLATKDDLESPPKNPVETIKPKSFYGSAVARPRPNWERLHIPTTPKQAVSKRRKSNANELSRKERPSKRSRSDFDINKAVFHAIKPAKPPSTPKTEKPPKAENTPSNSKPKSLYKVSPSRVGALNSSVCYVLKNGQYQFIRRRSPRKNPTNPYSTTPAKTPVGKSTKLFTPSGKSDMLLPSPKGKEGKNVNVPSPVKFMEDVDDKEESSMTDVSNLIDELDKNDDNAYAVYVSEDEIHDVAWKAAQEIQELDYGTEKQCEISEFNLSDIVGRNESEKENMVQETGHATPSKGRTSPRKKLALDTATSIRSSPRRSQLKKSGPNGPKSSEGLPLLQLSPMKQTPHRTPSKREKLLSTDETSSKSQKIFPIFTSGANSGIPEGKNKEPGCESKVYKKRKFVQGPSSNGDGLQQLIIDAGQKQFGSKQCEECKVFFNPSDPVDEELHARHHNSLRNDQLISFSGWKNERIVKENPAIDLKVILVKPSDPKRQLAKTKEVVEQVDNFLGVNHGIRQPSITDIYLAIMGSKVVGCLVSEPLFQSDIISSSTLRKGTQILSHDLNNTIPEQRRKNLCGISRVWVHNSYQRQGIATLMVEAVRCNFRHPLPLPKTELVFSHTTDMGAAFVTSYLKSQEFLVYRPNNP